MDRPHSNNSNNIHVTGAHLYNHSPQVPDKSNCNGDTGNGCFSVDNGYGSFNPENSQSNHSMCNLKSEQHLSHFQMPGSVPNGLSMRDPCHKVDPMQSPLQNGHMDPQPSQRYSGQGGPMRFSYSGEAVDEYQRPEHIPSGPPLTPYSQNGYQSRMQNGYTHTPSPQRCSAQGGPMHFSYSGEAVDEYQRPEPIPSGPPLTPFSQNGYQSRMQNGYTHTPSPQRCSAQGSPMHFSYSREAVDEYQRPEPIPSGHPLTPHSQNVYQSQVLDEPTSTRPPPVVRKHSSFMRQNAIEEEIDDIDELNDSGFGSMCRTTSQEKVRKSRSRDVSDAPTDDVNNNLAPRKLERAHSSQDRTDNDLAQYQGEKRRCSSEQLQRSNGSSGYHSAGNLQGELPTGDGTKPCDIVTETSAKSAASAEASAAASAVSSAEYMKDLKFDLNGLKGELIACQPEVWTEEDLHENILSYPDPALQQLLDSEVHSQLLKDMSLEFFSRSDLPFPQPSIPSDKGYWHIDIHVHEDEEGLISDHMPKTSGSLLISPNESAQSNSDQMPKTSGSLLISPYESAQAQDDQQGNDVTGKATATRQVPGEEVLKAPLHEDTLGQEPEDSLQTRLEKRAYCEAMGRNICLKCYMTEHLHKKFKECYRNGKLDQCINCREMVEAYWNHSKSCQSVRCVLPYCGYFKDLHSEKGLLHDPEMHGFEEALGCLIKEKEIDVLERLHELQQLQHPAADGEKVWSADANAESYLKKGQHFTHLTTEGRLCKLGHFSPIRCKARRHKEAAISVIIKKVRCYPSLTSTLKMLHSKSRPILKGIISTCLWYRQIKGEKLLVCSTYLSEKSLSSCLELAQDTLENYWIEACNAAMKLHESGILYLNWKVDHLLVTHEGHVKLCNFDYAVDIHSSRRELRGSCSEEWRGKEVPEHVKTGLDPRIAPPEVLDRRGLLPESDSWGLGCLLYQLYYAGDLPYIDLRHLSDDAIREKRLNEEHSKHVPDLPKIKLLSEMCWDKDQMKRKLPAELIKRLNVYKERMAVTKYRSM